jgi:NAD(P)-dependent dehydrogenase (short-subunit alcohol dehydrogenase family)
MTGRLAGRKALIVGGATGIGRAVAERFASENADLVLFGLGDDRLIAAARATGGVAIHGDVTKQADVDAAIDALQGELDIVVNAAGFITTDNPATIHDDAWERSLAVNATGTMKVCRAALPMLGKRGGAIVNIASVAAFNSGNGMASYSASKAALIAYTRSIANAHGRDGVRANVVAPGWVRTPMSEAEMDEAAGLNGTTREVEFAKLESGIGLGRIADAAEIASCCLFLACDEASFVTGAVLVADGGGRVPAAHRAV